MPKLAIRLAALAGLLCPCAPAAAQVVKTDVYGDPLPKGTLARLGTVRFRHESMVAPLAWSPDGKQLATAAGKVIRLWDPATGREIRRFDGHPDGVMALAFHEDGGLLVSHGMNQTLFIWEVATGTELFPHKLVLPVFGAAVSTDGRRLAAQVSEREIVVRLERWDGLASAGAAGWRAAAALAAAPGRAVAVLAKRLRPAAPVDRAGIDRLIEALNSGTFAARQKATKELEKIGEVTAGPMRAALAGKPPLEARRRMEQLLDTLEAAPPTPERLRQARAVAALEWAGTPAAREALEALSRGVPEAPLTQEARAALARLPR